MAFSINDECMECGACASMCPNEAIAQGESKYVIDAEKCIDCGICGDTCPVHAPNPA